MRRFLIAIILLVAGWATPSSNLQKICPAVGIQARTPDFSPGGIILTTFDKANLWVYNIRREARYPLPDTRPCGSNCRLSPDATWITYMNPLNNTYGKMRLDGTQRTLINEYATDIHWWLDGKFLIWTPGHAAYLQTEDSGEREYLDVTEIASVQPGGYWGLQIKQEGDGFSRALLDLSTRNLQGIAGQSVPLGEDRSYFNAYAWAPDGSWLAYVAPGPFDNQANTTGGEVWGIQPGDTAPAQWTDLFSIYGAARINGQIGGLSWSPDSTRLAFWVIELLGPDVTVNTGNALIHVYDPSSDELSVYCGFSTTEHTPNPPRLVWSPDSTHLAFGGNVPGDDKGYLLLALDVETGIFTELSNGIFPTLGTADVIAWGNPP